MLKTDDGLSFIALAKKEGQKHALSKAKGKNFVFMSFSRRRHGGGYLAPHFTWGLF